MFDISWFELMVVAVVALVIIGPKDLPRTIRSIAQWVRRGRQMMSQLRSGVDDMMREAELDDLRQQASKLQNYDIKDEAGRMIDPTGDVRTSVEDAMREAEDEGPPPAQAAERAVAGAEAQGEAAAKTEGAAKGGAKKVGTEKSGSGGKAKAKKTGQAKASPQAGTDDPAEAGGARD